MAEFRFTNEHRTSEVGKVIDALRRPRLWIPTTNDYPSHEEWLGKTEADIAAGRKRAMISYYDNEAVAAIVYRRHETLNNVVEIRNISVVPEARGRLIGSFALVNTELEAVRHDFPGTDTLMVDTKISNAEMIGFLENHGYSVQEIADLYMQGTELDAVLAKSLV